MKIVKFSILTTVSLIIFSAFVFYDDNNTDNSKPYEPEMVFVEGGTFTMGSTIDKPAYQATLNSFRIGKFAVTQAQWVAVMGNNPSVFQKGDNYPVENVNWYDAQEFITKLNILTGKNYRLPTDTEWEYAARGGSKSKGYKYSGSNNLDDVAWFDDNSGKSTHPVGTKQPNELGIYDMSGNVWEWCSDYHLVEIPCMFPNCPSYQHSRVMRGGCWINGCGGYSEYSCASQTQRRDNFGFRLILPFD